MGAKTSQNLNRRHFNRDGLQPMSSYEQPIPVREMYHSLGTRVGRIEDEQCQKTGGGYKAAKFRFLLFL